jgi:hypothetical protein
MPRGDFEIKVRELAYAEVLTGLKRAFSDYKQKNESAWRK